MKARQLTQTALATALAAITAASTGCGYALLGRNNSLPAPLKVIGIPDCQNQSGQPDIDRVLSDALRTEFSSRGKYTVLPQSTGVDALMTCTISSLQIQPTDVNQQHQAVGYTLVLTANIEFHDLTSANKILWANPAMQGREPYTTTNTQLVADPSSLLRDASDATARLTHTFARSVVSGILEGF